MNSITIEEVIERLNNILATDKDAIKKLIEYRVFCNDALKNHETVQVLCKLGGMPQVGLLGILNGIFGVTCNGYGYIGAVFDEDGELLRFEQNKE